MIAQRFRPLGWVAGVATAATGLYLVSLQVAAERGKLEAVERQIAEAQRDMRQLQTELGTRASLRQLEKWNGDVLAMSAPKAQQFLQNEGQLASVGAGVLDTSPNAPPAAMAASFTQPQAPDKPAAVPVATVQHAVFEKPAAPRLPAAAPSAPAPKVQRVAMLDRDDLNRSAAAERRKRP